MFLTDYLLEKTLAADNVFIWLMLFSYFAVPFSLQRRLLTWGILGAIGLRAVMVFAGSWLISEFQWLLYVFGAFLLFTGIKMALPGHNEQDIGNRPLVRWLYRHLRVTNELHGERFFIRRNGLLFATAALAGAVHGGIQRRHFLSRQHTGDLRRHDRSIYRVDLQFVCHPGATGNVFSVGQCGRTFLAAEIRAGGDFGLYRYQNAHCGYHPYSGRRIAGHGRAHGDADAQRLGQSAATPSQATVAAAELARRCAWDGVIPSGLCASGALK